MVQYNSELTRLWVVDLVVALLTASSDLCCFTFLPNLPNQGNFVETSYAENLNPNPNHGAWQFPDQTAPSPCCTVCKVSSTQVMLVIKLALEYVYNSIDQSINNLIYDQLSEKVSSAKYINLPVAVAVSLAMAVAITVVVAVSISSHHCCNSCRQCCSHDHTYPAISILSSVRRHSRDHIRIHSRGHSPHPYPTTMLVFKWLEGWLLCKFLYCLFSLN